MALNGAHNVIVRVEENKLHIEIDLLKERGMSGSGKSVVVGTTRGSKPIPELPGYNLNLNLFKPVHTEGPQLPAVPGGDST